MRNFSCELILAELHCIHIRTHNSTSIITDPHPAFLSLRPSFALPSITDYRREADVVVSTKLLPP